MSAIAGHGLPVGRTNRSLTGSATINFAPTFSAMAQDFENNLPATRQAQDEWPAERRPLGGYIG